MSTNQSPPPIGIDITTTTALSPFEKPNHHITNNKHIMKSHPADNDDNSTNVYYAKDDSAMMMGPLSSSLAADGNTITHTTTAPLTISLPRGHVDDEDVISLGSDDDDDNVDIDDITATATATPDGDSSSKEFSGPPSPSTSDCPVTNEESHSLKSVKSILMSEDISVRMGRLKRNVSWSDLAGAGELVEVKMYIPEKKSLLPAEAIFQDCVCSIM
jgi:hypothetical protein